MCERECGFGAPGPTPDRQLWKPLTGVTLAVCGSNARYRGQALDVKAWSDAVGFVLGAARRLVVSALTLYQRRQLLTCVGPVSHSDGHDGFGLIDELVPGLAASLDDGVVVFENAV